jgi:hypothetical protein
MGKDEKVVGYVSYNARVSNSYRIKYHIQAEKRLISFKDEFKFLRF